MFIRLIKSYRICSIKREIGHLCHDEQKTSTTSSKSAERQKNSHTALPAQIITPESNSEVVGGFTRMF